MGRVSLDTEGSVAGTGPVGTATLVDRGGRFAMTYERGSLTAGRILMRELLISFVGTYNSRRQPLCEIFERCVIHSGKR